MGCLDRRPARSGVSWIPVGDSESPDAVRASEAWYRHLFEANPMPMWVFDVETLGFLAVNDAAILHYGYSRDEFLAMTIADIRPPQDLTSLAEDLSALPTTSAPRLWRHRKKDGTLISVEVSAHSFTYDGRPSRLVLAHDVTERLRAEAMLHRSEARFKRLSESGLLGIIVADAAGRITEANDAFLRMVGYAADELVSGRVRMGDLTGESSRGPDAVAIAQLDVAGVAAPWEKQLVGKDGRVVDVVVGAAALDDDRYIGFVLDVSERKRLDEIRRRTLELEAQNAQVRHATRLKSEFLANMSHELRTPLNAILGFAELLHDGLVAPESPEHDEYLGDILTSGRHLLQLINDVLDLSKVEAGKLEFWPEAVSLPQLIAEVTGILRTKVATGRVHVEAHVADEVDVVVADPARLKQVLYNYLSNALKFTPPGGRIAVSVLSEGPERFRLEVADTGPGIAPDDLGRLFADFQQLGAGHDRNAGTGLGLSLTKRLVEAQGGAVGARSVVGQGSVFHAVLPRNGGAPLAADARAPVGTRAPLLLVVEDNTADRVMFENTLAAAGYAVETASTGREALVKCQERVFDAITLDLILPDMSGLEVLAGIRAGGLNAGVPIIVVTVVAEKGVVAGFPVHDILGKPLDGQALLASLRRAGVSPRGGTVLVVDDDPSALKLMSAALAQLGYRAVCAEDGRTGLALAHEVRPAAVVLDLIMPGMDGFEFLDRFRGVPEGTRTPVIIWTGKHLSGEEQARLRASANAVMGKRTAASGGFVEELAQLLRSAAHS